MGCGSWTVAGKVMVMEEGRGAHTVFKFQQGQVRRCDPVPESDHRRVSALKGKSIRHPRRRSWARRRSADRVCAGGTSDNDFWFGQSFEEQAVSRKYHAQNRREDQWRGGMRLEKRKWWSWWTELCQAPLSINISRHGSR